MLTVPQAAKRVNRHPETVRRWIREGKLPASKVGTQHVIEEEALEAFEEGWQSLPIPEAWRTLPSGDPAPDWAAAIRRERDEH